MVTKRDIFEFLEKSGVRPGDKVTMHISLRAVGPIEGGADGLLDGIVEYLREGMLIVPTHTWDNVNPESPCFDVRSTPPCLGTFAAVAAFRPDGFRSLHPTHSAAGFGRGAREFLAGEETCDTPAPLHSWLNRMYDENGVILLVGVGHDRNTYLHAVEERLNIPDRLDPETFQPVIIGHNGEHVPSPPYHFHKTVGFSESVSDRYPNFKKAFEYTGAAWYSTLGNAEVTVCSARKLADTLKLLWEKADYDLCSVEREVPEEWYRGCPK